MIECMDFIIVFEDVVWMVFIFFLFEELLLLIIFVEGGVVGYDGMVVLKWLNLWID